MYFLSSPLFVLFVYLLSSVIIQMSSFTILVFKEGTTGYFLHGIDKGFKGFDTFLLAKYNTINVFLLYLSFVYADVRQNLENYRSQYFHFKDFS